MRRVNDIIATLNMLIPPEILNNPAYHRPLGVPMNQPGASLLVNTEQVKLPA
ncbi:hypothetical protein ES703_97511 [subsurface metagenome]